MEKADQNHAAVFIDLYVLSLSSGQESKSGSLCSQFDGISDAGYLGTALNCV
jgi:hypothetical protein